MFSFSSVYTFYTVAIVLNFPQHQPQTLDYVELFRLKWMQFKVLFDNLRDGQICLTAGPQFSLRPRRWKSFRQNRTHSRKAWKPESHTRRRSDRQSMKIRNDLFCKSKIHIPSHNLIFFSILIWILIGLHSLAVLLVFFFVLQKKHDLMLF